MISQFGYLLLFMVGGVLLMLLMLTLGKLIRPQRPNEEKLTTYESGEDTVGNAWGQFNIRFYVIALLFVLFDVEIVFLFPWAVVFNDQLLQEETNGLWGWVALVEVLFFVLILLIGLVYAWKKGFLDWAKPSTKTSDFVGKVPPSLYEDFNKKY